ncbi:hypothetical protein N2152v2_011011 [Parachlorella kessleri]
MWNISASILVVYLGFYLFVVFLSLSIGFFLANVGLWCRYYYRSFYTIEYIGAFVLVTTVLVPFVLFLSMAGEQAVLPGAGGYPYSAGSSGNLNRTISGSLLGGGGTAGQGAAGAAAGAGQKRRSLALKLFDLLKRKRQQRQPAING